MARWPSCFTSNAHRSSTPAEGRGPGVASIGSILGRTALVGGGSGGTALLRRRLRTVGTGTRLKERQNSASAVGFLRLRPQESTNPRASLFDILFLDTPGLTRTPYFERRSVLGSLRLAGAVWSTPAAVVGHGRQALEMTRTAGLEGMVAKHLTSLYEPGIRSRAWIKVRHVRTEDIVIGGWVPGRGRLRLTSLPGALLMGQPHPGGELHYVGSVGTGWSDAERTTLSALSRPRRPKRARSPSGAR